jgi:asparagine synthetase B (glutamine-hydrolysing)/ADP-heptose:LPS heptosyltransferase
VSGIAAGWSYRRRSDDPDRSFVERAGERLGPRRVGHGGEWWSDDGRVGLTSRGETAGATATGAQPFADGSLAIVLVGEVYNAADLRVMLGVRGLAPRTTSTAELVLQMYRDRGPAAMDALRGMFAFALWDGTRQGMLLGRDAFGMKALYVSDDGANLRVASQVKALVAGGVDGTPDAAGHVGFFLFGYVPEPYTLFRSIRAVRPGTTLWIAADGSRVERRSPNPPSPSVGRNALRETVRTHFATASPALLLSGGRYSTALAAIAAEVGVTPRSITLAFDELRGTSRDPARPAEAVAQRFGNPHDTLWWSRESTQFEWDRLVDQMDQPSTDGLTMYFAARAAASVDVSIACTGLGGAELFGSRSAAPHLLFHPREVRKLVQPEIAEAGLRELGIDSRAIEDGEEIRRRVAEIAGSLPGRLPQRLRDADWTSAATDVEIRMPFVDRELWGSVIKPDDLDGDARTAESDLSTPSVEDWLIEGREHLVGARGVQAWARAVHEASASRAGHDVHPAVATRAAPDDEWDPSWQRRLLVQVAGHLDRRDVPPPIDVAQVRRILVLQLQNLGDTVAFTPALRALRRRLPDARIDLLASEVAAAFYEKCTYVNAVHVDRDPGPRRPSLRHLAPMLRRLRGHAYDLVVADANEYSMVYGAIAWAIGARYRLGYDVNGRGVLFTHRPALRMTQNVVDANLALLTMLGAEASDRHLECFYDADDLARARLRLPAPGGGPLVVIHPSTSMSSKLWFVDRWAALADLLASRRNAEVVFVGARSECGYVDAIRALATIPHRSIVGETTIPELAATMSLADLLVGTDSGPRHIGAAVGQPQVTVMSAWEPPHRWQFGWDTETVLRTDPWCSPCFRRECFHRRCMVGVTAEHVFRACAERLDQATR